MGCRSLFRGRDISMQTWCLPFSRQNRDAYTCYRTQGRQNLPFLTTNERGTVSSATGSPRRRSLGRRDHEERLANGRRGVDADDGEPRGVGPGAQGRR